MHNKEKSSSTWEKFWKENPTGFNSTMSQATLCFAETLDQKYPILPTDRILDIGCGPGFLVTHLKGKSAFVHGTDISAKYIQICKEQFEKDSNTSFSVSKVYDFEIYNELIKSNQINRVILLSVLQYYKS
jgi:2-polyprenyl-3-methyl-5-hydroxy-6-metoxy-1,4-benzoquinol methylase